MPSFHVTIPHSLSKEEATSRLQRFADALRSKYQNQVSDLEQSWEGDTLRFSFSSFGIGIKGKIVVAEKQLDLDGEIPFAAMIFKGKIESSIREELEKLLSA
jgi:putative polyhydroxyalkanoate system protein